MQCFNLKVAVVIADRPLSNWLMYLQHFLKMLAISECTPGIQCDAAVLLQYITYSDNKR